MSELRRILVANRGEIASRIIRSVHDSNLSAVAIYTNSDKDSPYVKEADQAVRIDTSYLDSTAIVKAAKETGSDAIHPGYGFLSENPDFPLLIKKKGLLWIGPSPKAISIMGDKIEAKKYAKLANLPILPSVKTEKSANKIGYPLLIKAAAGGGGKGMRIVYQKKELKDAIRLAKQEAKNAFGDDRIFIERYVESSRHIEVQILGDKKGNIIHLGERECSIQRRHQKIIEEAPSVRLSADIRDQLTSSAIALAKQIKYESAGTIEFLFDDKTNEFWFLEMNTRLQVEHPVTEMITGIDIVKEQIRIAKGQALKLTQEDITFTGHSIEARIYAEDPANDFLPSTGKLIADNHQNNRALRWDTGVEAGMQIGTDFDPMLAKVISYGSTREEASEKLAAGLEKTHFGGFANNIGFLSNILRSKDFIAGNTTTDFIELYQPEGQFILSESERKLTTISAALWLQELNRRTATVLKNIPLKLTVKNLKLNINDSEIVHLKPLTGQLLLSMLGVLILLILKSMACAVNITLRKMKT
jgi:propionyl-CoA carboxylase alpha chain